MKREFVLHRIIQYSIQAENAPEALEIFETSNVDQQREMIIEDDVDGIFDPENERYRVKYDIVHDEDDDA